MLFRSDITSVAALLVSRISEGKLQKNWLPSSIDPSEPLWWCYGRSSPSAPVYPHPLPSTFQAALLLWTPWRGSMWEASWRRGEERSDLYRWGRSPTLQDLLVWDHEIPQKILNLQHDPLFGRERVQRVLLEEAQHDILTRIATRSMV